MQHLGPFVLSSSFQHETVLGARTLASSPDTVMLFIYLLILGAVSILGAVLNSGLITKNIPSLLLTYNINNIISR